LAVASSPPFQRERRLAKLLSVIQSTFTSPPPHYPYRERVIDPYSQTNLWFFHFATYWRLAH
jgi:hypothetical protein